MPSLSCPLCLASFNQIAPTVGSLGRSLVSHLFFVKISGRLGSLCSSALSEEKETVFSYSPPCLVAAARPGVARVVVKHAAPS